MAFRKHAKHEENRSLSPLLLMTAAVFIVVLNVAAMLGMTFIIDTAKTVGEMERSINKIVLSLRESDRVTNALLNNYESYLCREIQFADRLIEDGAFTDSDAKKIADWLQEENFAILDESGNVLSTSFSSSFLYEHGKDLVEQAKQEFTEQSLYYYDDEENEYHSLAMHDQRYGVVRRPGADVQRYIQETVTVSQLVEQMYTESTVMLMAKDGVLFYAPKESTLKDGMKESEFLNLFIDFVPGRGVNQYLSAGRIGKKNYLILKFNMSDNYEGYSIYLCLWPDSYLRQSFDTVWIFAPVMIVVFIVSLYYMYQLRKEPYDRRRDSRKVYRIRVVVTVLTGWVILTFTAFFARSISCLSALVMNNPEELAEIEKVYEDAQVRADNLKEAFNAFSLRNAKLIQNYMNDFPAKRNEETYRELSDLFQLDYILQFDQDGNQAATDGGFTGLRLSTRTKDASYAFRPILNGVDTVLQDPMYDDLSAQNHQVIGVCLRDGEGRPNGLLQIAMHTPGMDEVMKSSELSTVLGQTINTLENFYYLIDPETNIFLYSPLGEFTGYRAQDYGFTKEILRPGYTGYMRIDGIPYYLSSTELAGKLLYIAVPTANIFMDRWKYTEMISFTVLAEYVLFLLLLKQVHPSAKKEEQPETPIQQERTGVLRRILRRIPVRPHESQQSAAEKTARLLRYVCSAMILLLALAVIFRDEVFGKNSILSFVMQGDWKPGLNIFAFTAVLIMVIFMLAAVWIIREILSLLARVVNPGGETLCRLLRSAVEYVAFFAAVFLTMQFLGINVQTLMTSAGILTLIVGLGANNLIADTIAGLFLIFEGEFQVGDVIEISGQTGVVKEIGIHSATLVDDDNNVLILSNSKVSDIIKLSEGKSFASVSFRISCEVSVSHLEELFAKELASLAGTIDGMSGAPYFRGITALENRTITCLVMAEAEEKKKKAVQRELYLKVVQILHRDGIELV